MKFSYVAHYIQSKGLSHQIPTSSLNSKCWFPFLTTLLNLRSSAHIFLFGGQLHLGGAPCSDEQESQHVSNLTLLGQKKNDLRLAFQAQTSTHAGLQGESTLSVQFKKQTSPRSFNLGQSQAGSASGDGQ